MIKANLEQVDNTYRNNPRFRKTIFEFDDVPVVEGESAYSDKGYLRIRAQNDRFELLVDTDFLDDRYDYNYLILDGVRHSLNDFDSWEQVEEEINTRL